MKKFKLLILTFMLALSIIGLTACGDLPDFKVSFMVDGEIYAVVETTGEEKIEIPANPEKTGYNFDGWFWDDGVWEKPFTANSLLDAPISSDMRVYAKFSVPHEHNYVETTVNPTCTEKGYIKHACECGEISEIVYKADELGHDFGGYVPDGNATIESDGTKTASCKRSGCNEKNTVPDVGSMLVSKKLEFDTLTVNKVNNLAYNVYGKLANGTTSFDFEEEITPTEDTTYSVYTDANGQNEVGKTVTLNPLDNVFYLHMDNHNNNVVYTVTIRVKPIYTVSFDSNEGSAVSSQQVEEDGYATKPSQDPTYTGHDFGGWDFDFDSTPITGDITITAKDWTAKILQLNYHIPNDDGYTVSFGKYVTYNEKFGELDSPTRLGYGFMGWYTTESGGDKIESTDTVTFTTNTTVYARWLIDFTYELDSARSVYIVTKANREGDLVVLNKIGHLKVVEFTGNGGYNQATSIDMSHNENLSEIEDNTFEDCSALKSIKLAPNIQKIGKNAFDGCTKLESVTMSERVTSIGENAFNYCRSLKNITFSSELKSIGKMAFCNCEKLTNVVIPDKVTSIGEQAFYNCFGLESITVGKGVVNIYKQAFYGCKKLTEIKFNATAMNDAITSNVIHDIFRGAGNDTDGLVVTVGANVTKIPAYLFYTYDDYSLQTKIKSVAFEANSQCTTIGASAFYSRSTLTSIEIPDSMTSIGDNAFTDCDGLTMVNYKGTVEKWATKEFTSNPLSFAKRLYINGEEISSVTLSDITKVSDGAFKNCSSITQLTLSGSLKDVGVSAFSDCSNLAEITLLDSVQNIDSQAFFNCINLTTLNGCNGLITLGNSAFSGCVKLTNIIIAGSLTSIGDNAFKDCNSLSSIEVDENHTQYMSIDGVLFNKEGTTLIQYPAGRQTTSYVVPSGVTAIAGYAFNDCTYLQEVTISEGVLTLNSNAFYNCSVLRKISVPNSLTTLADGAFSDCNALIYNEEKNDDTGSIICYLGNTTNPYLVAMKLKESSKYVWLNENTKFIHTGAFSGSSKLDSVRLSASLVSIGNGAFRNCSALKSISIYGSDLIISSSVFSYCKRLTTVYLENVKSIGYNAFAYCDELTTVNLGTSLEAIGVDAFYNCDKLEEITIPASVTQIGHRAFGKTGLNYATFEDKETWYITSNSDYTGGEILVLADFKGTNGTYLAETYLTKYWYKV